MMSGLARLAGSMAALAAALWVPVAACGLEGGLGDSLSAAHPGSLEVAFAVRDAIDGGALVPDAALEPSLAHERADERLRAMAAALPASRSKGSVAVLLIEPGTWTRITPKAGAWSVTGHADGPQSSDATLLASEPALRDLIDGKLSADEALVRGWVVVGGDRRHREPLVAALRRAYPARLLPVALR